MGARVRSRTAVACTLRTSLQGCVHRGAAGVAALGLRSDRPGRQLCSVSQSVAPRCPVVRRVAPRCPLLRRVAPRCPLLHCVAPRCPPVQDCARPPFGRVPALQSWRRRRHPLRTVNKLMRQGRLRTRLGADTRHGEGPCQDRVQRPWAGPMLLHAGSKEARRRLCELRVWVRVCVHALVRVPGCIRVCVVSVWM